MEKNTHCQEPHVSRSQKDDFQHAGSHFDKRRRRRRRRSRNSRTPSEPRARRQQPVVQEPWLAKTEDPINVIQRKTNKASAVARGFWCPSQKHIQTWLQIMSKKRKHMYTEPFGDLMTSMGWTAKKVHKWFHYPSFKTLWTSTQRPRALASNIQQQASVDLLKQGGRKCMQFHFYVLDYVTRCDRFTRCNLRQQTDSNLFD